MIKGGLLVYSIFGERFISVANKFEYPLRLNVIEFARIDAFLSNIFSFKLRNPFSNGAFFNLGRTHDLRYLLDLF